MKRPIIFMFSGQGSQYYQMGRELLEKEPVFREQMIALDTAVRARLGTSIIEQCYAADRKKSERFDRTLHTHPAIFMVEYAMMQTLKARGIVPDCVLGASLGEFAAAVCAGVLELDDALDLVLKQASSLETCPQGGMLAVLEDPALYDQEPALFRQSEMAGINFYSHFVISGLSDNLQRIQLVLKQRGVAHQLLPVAQAFHSSFIDGAAGSFVPSLAEKNYRPPRMTYLSSVSGGEEALPNGAFFWEVVRKPILFRDVIERLESNGSAAYVDVGPSGTLATFVKYILDTKSTSQYCSIMSPFGNDLKNLQAATTFCYNQSL